jgi:hypothetical protein
VRVFGIVRRIGVAVFLAAGIGVASLFAYVNIRAKGLSERIVTDVQELSAHDKTLRGTARTVWDLFGTPVFTTTAVATPFPCP